MSHRHSSGDRQWGGRHSKAGPITYMGLLITAIVRLCYPPNPLKDYIFLTGCIHAINKELLGTALFNTWNVKYRSWLLKLKLWTMPPVRSCRARVVNPV